MRRTFCLLSILLLAACQAKEPAGQVVARVDGEDITRRDLLIEMQANGLPADSDLAKVQGPLLDAIVSRKLLVAQARAALIDRTPDYLASIRRARELALAGELGNRMSAQMPAPTAQDVGRYIADNPQRFSRREIITIDRIALSAGAALPALPTGATMADAAASLAKAHIAFTRSSVMIDTQTLEAIPGRALLARPVGRSVVAQDPDGTVIDAVVARSPLAMTDAQQTAAARALLSAAARQQRTATLVAELRRQAKVDFQPGYGPR
jgi:EpsD family peptidyl-prolyl cis-trans isomerase